MRVIKRYQNRKLYDTELSKYVTLDDILELALNDSPFKVLDNVSQRDITGATLFMAMSTVMQDKMDIASIKQIINQNRALFENRRVETQPAPASKVIVADETELPSGAASKSQIADFASGFDVE